MMRKFRKIFRTTTTIPTINKNEHIYTTSSPESTSDEASSVKQISSSINKQLFTGRQKKIIIFLFFLSLPYSFFILNQDYAPRTNSSYI